MCFEGASFNVGDPSKEDPSTIQVVTGKGESSSPGFTFDSLNAAAIIVILVVGSIVLIVSIWVVIIWRSRRNAAVVQRRKDLTCMVGPDDVLYLSIDSKPPLSPVHYGGERVGRIQTFNQGRDICQPQSRHSLSSRIMTGGSRRLK